MPRPSPVEISNPPRKFSTVLPYQDIYPRTKTVENLAEILDEQRVVHVRGTPSSGKTTLAHLLYQHYENRKEPVISIEGWLHTPDPIAFLVNKCNALGYHGITLGNLINSNVVFLFDEAQQSYHDSRLWLGLIKTQSCRSNGPRICLFSSYGSPATGPTEYPYGSTPIHLGAPQRVSITVSRIPDSPKISLFYNEAEFEEVVGQHCSNPTKKFTMDSAACEYLYSITSGHPGAVTSLLGYIFKVCRNFTLY